MPQKRRPKRKQLAHVNVEAELHQEPDWDRFAWALLQYARILVAKAEEADKEPSAP